jgi:putative hydrolase of the HAD superfamily
MTIKAVIFDLDDTLYDEKEFVKSGFKVVSSYMAKKCDLDEEKFYNLLLSVFSEKGRNNVFDLALKKLNMHEKGIVAEMVRIYREHFPNITLFREAQKLLPELKKEYRLGLVTDGIKEVQKNKVEALNIESLFDVITYAVEFGGKNNAEPFLATLERLKVKPSESIYVDDNPLKGFTAAKKIGVITVRVLKGEDENIEIVDEQSKPDFQIRSLRELLAIINMVQG